MQSFLKTQFNIDISEVGVDISNINDIQQIKWGSLLVVNLDHKPHLYTQSLKDDRYYAYELPECPVNSDNKHIPLECWELLDSLNITKLAMKGN